MLILIWVILAIAVAFTGDKKDIGFTLTLILSLILSPLIGLILVLISAPKGASNKDTKLDDLQEEARKLEFIGDSNNALMKYKELYYESKKRHDSGKYNKKNTDKIIKYMQTADYGINRIEESIQNK
jgi:hypothetical protein